MNPQSFLFHLFYPHIHSFGTKTRLVVCDNGNQTNLIHSSCRAFSQHDGLHDYKRPVIVQGESKSPSGFLRAQPLNALSAISCMRNGVPVRHEHI